MFDELDMLLIEMLRKNARISTTLLARQLSQPIPTIRDRIKRLERKGIIKGYTAVVDLEKIGLGIKAVVLIKIGGAVSDADQFLAGLRDIPAVESAFLVTGCYEALVMINVADTDHLRKVVCEEIPSISGVDGTNTMLVLAESHAMVPT